MSNPHSALPTTQKGHSLFYRRHIGEWERCSLLEVEAGFTPRAAPGISSRNLQRHQPNFKPSWGLDLKKALIPSPKSRAGLCFSTPVALMLKHTQSPLQSLLKHGVLPSSSGPHQPLPTHRLVVSRSVGLGGGPGVCLSHKPPGMLVQGPHFEKDCSRTSFGSGSGSTTASPSYPSARLRLLSLQGQCLVFFFFFFGCTGSSSLRVDVFGRNGWRLLSGAARGLLVAVASLVVSTGSSTWAQWFWLMGSRRWPQWLWWTGSVAQRIRHLHIPGIRTVSPALTLLHHLLNHWTTGAGPGTLY